MSDKITQPLIRNDESGLGVNYGTLVLAEIDGRQFLVEDWKLDQVKIPYTRLPPEDIPEFLFSHKLDVKYTDRADFIAHVMKKEDMRPLGLALSAQLNCWVGGNARGRWLMTWDKGVVASDYRPIDQFYLGMTQQDIDASAF
jgi:hypothetical protein